MNENGPDLAAGVLLSDFDETGLYGGTLDGVPVVIVKTDDRLCAFAGTCTHLGAPLKDGVVVDGTLRCPWHHARFSLDTGEAVAAPAFKPLSPIKVREQGGRIFVDRDRVDASAAVVVIPIMFQYVGFESAEAVILDLVRWPIMLGLGALGFALAYRFGPSHHEHRGCWITWGSACAACVWLAMSLLFSWYTANLGSYNKTYGSLGAVIGFMTWLWLSTVVILIGAEIDALRHQQKEGANYNPRMPAGPS